MTSDTGVNGESAAAPSLRTGGRSVAAPGFGAIDFKSLPSNTQEEYLSLSAEDGGVSRAVLYTRGQEKTVVYFMHPRADMHKHYAMSGLLAAGFATFGHNSRWLNNDIACIHEVLLLDIAAGVRALRDRGFERIVLVGNSGGGSLMTFYQAQASLKPPGRLAQTPAGDPPDLNRYHLPVADALILLAAHPGQGKFLLDCIDPSVVDEGDMLATDVSLDMYDPINGFRELPEQSRYSPEFLALYRAGQSARVARLDAIAESRIAAQNHYKELMSEPEFLRGSEKARQFILRRATAVELMTIYRTDANPASCDLSLSPSKRDIGSIIGPRPDIANYSSGGFAGVVTPRAWLSTWSGHRSRASVHDNIAGIAEPTLIVNYTGDGGIFPDQLEAILSRSRAADKSIVHVDGDHYGLPIKVAPDVDARAEAQKVMAAWLTERF
jgi:hypothetical protein